MRPVRVDPRGVAGPTKAAAAGPRWRRTSKGYYVPVGVTDELPEQRILEKSMRLPPGGAVTGWAACRLLGAAFFDGLATDGRTRVPVPLWVGDLAQLTKDEHARVVRDRMVPGELTRRSGIPCTRPLRALFDEARVAPDVREAVVAVDMMAAAELSSIQQLVEYVDTMGGVNGVPQVREALELASEDSRSPNETRLRLIWQLDAGLPRPLVNQPVFHRGGRLLGIADLLDPVAGVVGEFDGADHRSAARHSADVDRENRFRDAGLEVFRVTGPDIPRRGVIVARILAARGRAPVAAAARPCLDHDAPGGLGGGASLHERSAVVQGWPGGPGPTLAPPALQPPSRTP